MKVGTSFPTKHKEIVHYIAYDFYGQRIATCSSDHTIRVWNLDSNKWVLSDELKVCVFAGASSALLIMPTARCITSPTWQPIKDKGHTGPVWKVVWGHPEFGQVLASCSFDRSVIIWEEQGV